MTEEELLKQQSESQGEQDNTDYIQAIKSLKENSVSKDKYDALAKEKKELLDALVNGQGIDQQNEASLESREHYYKKYKENNFSNDLDYWDNFLKLRKATIKEYGADPCVTGNYGFTPEGGRAEPEYGEKETIEEQMKLIEDLIKESEGNPIVFETLLQSSLPRK